MKNFVITTVSVIALLGNAYGAYENPTGTREAATAQVGPGEAAPTQAGPAGSATAHAGPGGTATAHAGVAGAPYGEGHEMRGHECPPHHKHHKKHHKHHKHHIPKHHKHKHAHRFVGHHGGPLAVGVHFPPVDTSAFNACECEYYQDNREMAYIYHQGYFWYPQAHGELFPGFRAPQREGAFWYPSTMHPHHVYVDKENMSIHELYPVPWGSVPMGGRVAHRGHKHRHHMGHHRHHRKGHHARHHVRHHSEAGAGVGEAPMYRQEHMPMQEGRSMQEGRPTSTY